jgi:hypothetical protein
VLLPAGLYAGRFAKGSAFIMNNAMPYETCLVYAAQNSNWLNIYRPGLAAFPAGAGVNLFLEITVCIL